MKMGRVTVLLTPLIAASVIATVVATTGTTLTWSKTFSVTSPEIAANIQIGNVTIIGYNVSILVALRIQSPSSGSITIKGNYSASLFWLNTTTHESASECYWKQGQWQQVYTFPSETNVTLTTSWQTFTNTTYTPTQVGQYKVVATFTTNSEVQTFSSED